MKGQHKFSPRSGAELSDQREYPGTIPLREALDGSGELTNGELVSREATALLTRFKECHQRGHDPDPELYFEAWNAIQALRNDEDTPTPWDCWLWYCLAERLHREGYDTEWMLAHVEARCPRCSSRLQYEASPMGFDVARCATKCGADSPHRTYEIMTELLDLYTRGFVDADDDPIERFEIF